jgi:sulfur-oxidizing protein SoxA
MSLAGRTAVAVAVAVVAGLAGPTARPAAAQPAATATTGTATDTRRSGLLDMSPALQALQRDDAQNPGLLMVQDGQALWARREGAAQRACADCHGPAESSMRGVATRHPAIDAHSGQPINLDGRIRQCRTQRQQAPDWPAEHPEALALGAWLGLLSRGQPIAPPADARLAALQAEGRALWSQRLGQLNLACTHCHDHHAGQRLGGAVIPQGHPTGYPIYRLEWQGLGSLQRRLRACLTGVRAEPFAPGARAWLALEAWLMRRAAGMPVETPAVRP